MNKKIVLLTIVSALAACGEKDLAYYQEHGESAKTKYQECVAQMTAAYQTKNESQLIALKNDIECQYAETAAKKHHREKRALEIEQTNKKYKKEMASKQKTQQIQMDKRVPEYQQLPPESFFDISIKFTCRTDFYSLNKPECRAYLSLLDSKTKEGVNLLVSTLTGEEIQALRLESCSGKLYDTDKCKFYQKAVKAKKNQLKSN